MNLLKNRDIPFVEWTWEDGSSAIADPRGFVHLKSSDLSLPEITILTRLGGHIACWASNGVSSGAADYINSQQSGVVAATGFYNNYIQKFIDRLM